MFHEATRIYSVISKVKEKKILDRIIAHQLIILENPPQNVYIEGIKLKQDAKKSLSVDALTPTAGANPATDSRICQTVTTIDGKKGPMAGVVRPSSLNYKISLIDAVKNYISKEKL